MLTASALLPCRTTKTSRFQQKCLKAKLATVTFATGSSSYQQRLSSRVGEAIMVEEDMMMMMMMMSRKRILCNKL